MVPVMGLALYNFAPHHRPAAWLITSLIDTEAYVAAAVRLDSRVLVYLSLTLIASTAWSGVSVLGGALLWYFAAMIGVAVLLTFRRLSLGPLFSLGGRFLAAPVLDNTGTAAVLLSVALAAAAAGALLRERNVPVSGIEHWWLGDRSVFQPCPANCVALDGRLGLGLGAAGPFGGVFYGLACRGAAVPLSAGSSGRPGRLR